MSEPVNLAIANPARVRAYRDLPVPYGDTLEIGLGEGLLADELIANPNVTKLVSYELDLTRIQNYTVKDESRHTIHHEDAETATVPGTFDSCIVDTIETYDDYIPAKRILHHLLPNFKTGTQVFVEFMADIPQERDLRQWLNTNVGPWVVHWVPVLYRNGLCDRHQSRHIGYFVQR